MMYGQESLLARFNSLTIDSLSQAVLLVGEWGCGKHTLVHYLAERFSVRVIDISDSISADYVEGIITCVFPTFYIIKSSAITERQESILLKVLEEPPSTAFIFILAENEQQVLLTIKNRCQVYRFSSYDITTLKTFSEKEHDDSFYQIANTPGKVIVYNSCNLSEMQDFCYKLLTKIPVASFSNVLVASDRIDFKDVDQTKFNYNLFLDMLIFCAVEIVKCNSDSFSLTIYEETRRFIEDVKTVLYIDKVKRFENYLCRIKLLKYA